MREVSTVATKADVVIKFTTASGSVYELSKPGSDGKRTLTKKGTSYVGFLGIAANAKEIASIYASGGSVTGIPLPDARIIIRDQTLAIGNCLGFVFETGGNISGLGSTQIKKIEIE
jgi:hypothetical protein